MVAEKLKLPERAAFPLDVLPTTIRQMVQAVAAATETPVELAAMLALPVISTGVQRRVQVQVRSDWCEELSIYAMVVLDSGEGKSPVFRHMLAPVLDYERELRAAWQQDADRHKQQPDTVEHPGACPRLYTSDATTEKLAVLLDEQDERMAVLSAEGGILDVIGGRYSPKGMTASLDLYLKAWGGEPVVVDRQRQGSIYLERPTLSIGLTVQPATLEHLANSDYLSERGLLARFLIAVPVGKVGTRLHPDDPPVLPAMTAAAYAATVRQLYTMPDDSPPLTITPDGYRTMQAYLRTLEPLLPTSYAAIKAPLAKTAAQVARIAGVLHLADDPFRNRNELDAPAIERAITLHQWLIPHQQAAANLSSTTTPIVKALRTLAGWMQDHQRRHKVEGNLVITLRQARQYTHLNKELLLEALTLLDEMGLVQEVETKRRDSRWYAVPDVQMVQEYAAQCQHELQNVATVAGT